MEGRTVLLHGQMEERGKLVSTTGEMGRDRTPTNPQEMISHLRMLKN